MVFPERCDPLASFEFPTIKAIVAAIDPWNTWRVGDSEQERLVVCETQLERATSAGHSWEGRGGGGGGAVSMY